MNNRESNHAIWTARIEEWKRSGLSQRRYCNERGVALSTFHLWRKRLRGTTEKTEANALVEVPVVAGLPTRDDISIVVGHYTVRIPTGVDMSRLLGILDVLDNR